MVVVDDELFEDIVVVVGIGGNLVDKGVGVVVDNLVVVGVVVVVGIVVSILEVEGVVVVVDNSVVVGIVVVVGFVVVVGIVVVVDNVVVVGIVVVVGVVIVVGVWLVQKEVVVVGGAHDAQHFIGTPGQLFGAIFTIVSHDHPLLNTPPLSSPNKQLSIQYTIEYFFIINIYIKTDIYLLFILLLQILNILTSRINM